MGKLCCQSALTMPSLVLFLALLVFITPSQSNNATEAINSSESHDTVCLRYMPGEWTESDLSGCRFVFYTIEHLMSAEDDVRDICEESADEEGACNCVCCDADGCDPPEDTDDDGDWLTEVMISLAEYVIGFIFAVCALAVCIGGTSTLGCYICKCCCFASRNEPKEEHAESLTPQSTRGNGEGRV